MKLTLPASRKEMRRKGRWGSNTSKKRAGRTVGFQTPQKDGPEGRWGSNPPARISPDDIGFLGMQKAERNLLILEECVVVLRAVEGRIEIDHIDRLIVDVALEDVAR